MAYQKSHMVGVLEECINNCLGTDEDGSQPAIGSNQYSWMPSQQQAAQQQMGYVHRLECELHCLQKAFLNLTTNYARMQFRLRQVIQATPHERDALLKDLEKMAFEGATDNDPDELPHMQRDLHCMGNIRRKQNDIIDQLRMQLTELSDALELEAEPPEGNAAGGRSTGGGLAGSGQLAGYRRFPCPPKKKSKKRQSRKSSTRSTRSSLDESSDYNAKQQQQQQLDAEAGFEQHEELLGEEEA